LRLAGVFSDDIFKEQNAILEEKIIAAHAAKDDSLIDKYDINASLHLLRRSSLIYQRRTPNQL